MSIVRSLIVLGMEKTVSGVRVDKEGSLMKPKTGSQSGKSIKVSNSSNSVLQLTSDDGRSNDQN